MHIGMATGPDPRWGIHLLGDVNGLILLPTGSLAGQNSSLSGEVGAGTFPGSPSPIPIGGLEFICMCIRYRLKSAQQRIYGPSPQADIKFGQ